MKIFLLPFFLLWTIVSFSQTDPTPEHIDSLLKKANKKKGKYISNYKVFPRETFAFNKRSKELIYIRILYPWDRVIEFYSLNNLLIKMKVSTQNRKEKRTYWSYYYFHNDTLIYKKENTASQNVQELQNLFINYRIKSEQVKAKFLGN